MTELKKIVIEVTNAANHAGNIPSKKFALAGGGLVVKYVCCVQCGRKSVPMHKQIKHLACEACGYQFNNI